MRSVLAVAVIVALAGCGGGGGGSAPAPVAPSQPTSAPVVPPTGYVTPTFVIRIPARTNAKSRSPKYISSATASVVITLTADSVSITPSSIVGNPATTTIAAGTCDTGCTVTGPPTPPGIDSFRIVTYDNATPASGHALNAGQLNSVAITAGQANTESVTLGAIPVTLTLSNIPTNVFNAGTQSQIEYVTVSAQDAAGTTIPRSQSPSVTYVDATGAPISITISDPDTKMYGSCMGTMPCDSGAATSATLNGPDAGVAIRYDGLAENPVTLTVSAPTATSITATIQPNLNAPAFNGSQATPGGVALPSSAEIDLFATSGIGSTGSESFTESGWTNAPYNHALIPTVPAGCASIATAAAGTNDTTNGTPITATVVASPSPGSCTVTVGDGLTANTTDGTASLLLTYTTSSVNANSKKRHQ